MKMIHEPLPPFGQHIYPVPVVHFRLEFADAVRSLFLQIKPDAVAVELPHSLREVVQRGVLRLPELSVVFYQNKHGDTIYLPIESTDPIMEAIRSGLDCNLPVYFVDLDLDTYPCFHDYFPDPYAAFRLGVKTYYDTFHGQMAAGVKKTRDDLRREEGMAYRLQKIAAQHKKILFVCGLAHLEGIKKAFLSPRTNPLEIINREGVSLFNLHPEDLIKVTTEYPFLTAAYEYRRGKLPPEPNLPNFTVKKKLGILTSLTESGKTSSEEEALDASVRWTVHHINKGPMDRQMVSLRLFEQAARHYHQDTEEEVSRSQKQAFFRFSRNYALMEKRLLPDLYQLLTSARSCVDDNFCYAFFRLSNFYPWQKTTSSLPTYRMSEDMLWLGTRKILIKKRIPRIKRCPVHVPTRLRQKEKKPGEWLEGFDDPHICSYPPEDIIIEGYANFLKTKGSYLLSTEGVTSVPFETTILDGIDLRETARHIHEDRIYVKEFKRVRGAVGSVVVIFDEDVKNERYPYRITWLGEHNQESDMAFYATNPTDHVVGPGILRCTYGGLMMTFPPMRVADVWGDHDYHWAQTKAERLLLAGLEYSLDKYTVYVADSPPRSLIKSIAAKWEKGIIYIPIGQLSSVKLKQIRTLHILSGRDKRKLAGEYIW